jgi:hypothetical protein
MTEGGKRRANKSLKQWVAFVKKVAKEEGLEYREAMMRAKARSDKGEKWQKGGDDPCNAQREALEKCNNEVADKVAANTPGEDKTNTPGEGETNTPGEEVKTNTPADEVKTDGGRRQQRQSDRQQRQSGRQQRQSGRQQRQSGRRQSRRGGRRQSGRQSRRDRR